jgi:anti-sigma regulatory factor (Ser/Thr protein kinase)
MIDLDLNLPIDARSPARARHALDDVQGRIPADVMERFRIAVTELVTNSIQHADLAPGDVVRVLVQVRDDHLRVEVINAGLPFATRTRRPGSTRESGRGLMLVERSTDRWGMKGTDGVRLWFEIDLPRPAQAERN